MAYATIGDVEARMARELTADDIRVGTSLLDDAATLIDAYNTAASDDAKKVVSCRMVIRALGDGNMVGVPAGASQGSMSALGYSQSWTMTGGSVGEIYLSKTDRTLLGVGNRIGAYSPVEEFTEATL